MKNKLYRNITMNSDPFFSKFFLPQFSELIKDGQKWHLPMQDFDIILNMQQRNKKLETLNC